MALTLKEKELVAVGISVAAGCRPCTRYHLRAVREAGASQDEIRAGLRVALQARKSAAERMEHWALALLDADEQQTEAEPPAAVDRLEQLTGLGATFSVNCSESLREQLERAEKTQLDRDEILEVVKLAVFIKQMAASHVEKLVGWEPEEKQQSDSQSDRCC